MKKMICFLLVLMMVFSLAGCGEEAKEPATNSGVQTEQTETPTNSGSEEIPADSQTAEVVDLTALSSTIIYAEVYNMMVTPDDYIGKTVKMKGQFAVYEDQNTGNLYFAVIIADATACCSQGIEFVLDGDYTYPEDYPELGTEITVTGEFQTYEENGYLYCHLVGAEML